VRESVCGGGSEGGEEVGAGAELWALVVACPAVFDDVVASGWEGATTSGLSPCDLVLVLSSCTFSSSIMQENFSGTTTAATSNLFAPFASFLLPVFSPAEDDIAGIAVVFFVDCVVASDAVVFVVVPVS
jgi:hypothetical protein